MSDTKKASKIDFMTEQLINEEQDSSGWRSKSFQANPTESHTLPLMPATNLLGSIMRVQAPQIAEKIPPRIPKIVKINNQLFAVLLNNRLTIFYYLSNQQKSKRRSTKNFISSGLDINLPIGTLYMCSNDGNMFYAANQEQMIIIEITVVQSVIEAKQIHRQKIQEIKCISFYKTNLHNKLAVITTKQLRIYNTDQSYQKLQIYSLQFDRQSSGLKNLETVTGIQIIAQDTQTLYFMSSSEQKRSIIKSKLGRGTQKDDQPQQKRCQALYVTRLKLKQNKVQARIFIIDFIFQLSIFKRSRVNQVGPQTFLLSLYEQVIVIKRNFDKFIVWDNVSIAPSKSNEKRCQLLLAGKRILLCSQSSGTFVNELYFDQSQAQLKLPFIDSFKGNDNDQDTMYDALIFQYEPGNYMAVIFYFKTTDIDLPGRPRPLMDDEQTKKPSIPISILSILQINPTTRLRSLLKNNKPPEQIQAFVKRFSVSDLVHQKCLWQVSSKTEVQIQGILLQIKDNQYIQTELTNILKSKPHDLQFLLTIETKQIQRFKNMFASLLLKIKQTQKAPKYLKNVSNQTKIISAKFTAPQISEIKQTMAWLLQAVMFQKKLQYSQNFLSFKEYDFIEIGKLKSASLRQQIKLLGCKGFEKRLKYFLNSFKYLILDDFREIIRFFLDDMNEHQIQICLLKNFSFILPTYQYKNGQDKCLLWQNNFEQDYDKILTKNILKQQIKKQIKKIINQKANNHQRISQQQATEKFGQIFQQFINQDWYKANSYKQHSLLKHTVPQLTKYFNQLKYDGVFRIISQQMYEKVQKKQYSVETVKRIINNLTDNKLFQEDFTLNMYVRGDVYELIRTKKVMDFQYSLPKKSIFINMTEGQYFRFLFRFFKSIILGDIKKIYQNYKKDFFQKRFKIFLYDQNNCLSDLIDFLNYFTTAQHQAIRQQLIKRISQLLKFVDTENTKSLITLLMDKQVVFGGEFSIQNPVPQAKLVLSSYFAPLFNYFRIDCTYYNIIMQSNKKNPQQVTILNQIIHKFCSQFDSQKSIQMQFDKNDYLDEIPPIDLSQSLDFLAIVLYFRSLVHYQIQNSSVLEKILVQFVKAHKYQDLKTFIGYLFGFGKKFEQQELSEKYPHYGMIQILRQNPLKKQIQDSMLKYVKQKYKQLNDYTLDKELTKNKKQSQNYNQIKMQIAVILLEISQTLTVVNEFINSDKVVKQIKYLSILQNTKTLNIQSMSEINQNRVKNQQSFIAQNNFDFLMNIFKTLNPQFFDQDDSDQISKHITIFQQIHTDYGFFQKGNTINEQLIFGEYCRFVCEFIVYLVDHKYFKPAAYNIFQIIKTSYYYRDVLFYMITRIITNQVPKPILYSLLYTVLTQTNSNSLMIIIDNFFMVHKIKQFRTFQSVQQQQQNIMRVFDAILANNQLDEAFFSLLRNNTINYNKIEQALKHYPKYKRQSITIHKLLVQYMRALRNKNRIKYYPTFENYKSKYNSLCKDYERMDIIKDIFIFISQLEIQILKMYRKLSSKNIDLTQKVKIQQQIQQLQNDHKVLQQMYLNYMQQCELDPELSDIFQKDQKSGNKIQKLIHQNTQINIQIHTEGNQQGKPKISKNMEQIAKENMKLLDNQRRLKQIRQRNQQLLNQEIVPSISQAKKTVRYKKAEQDDTSLLQRKTQKKKDPNLQQLQQAIRRDNENFKKIFDAQYEQIESLKNNYHSDTVQVAMKKLDEFRKQRMLLKQELGLTTKTEAQENAKMAQSGQYKVKVNNDAIDLKPPSVAYKGGMRESMFNSGLYGSQMLRYGQRSNILDPKQIRKNINNMKQSTYRVNKKITDKNSEYYVPKRQLKPPTRVDDYLFKDEHKPSIKLDKLKKSILDDKQKQKKTEEERTHKKKLSLPEIKQKYAKIQPKTVPYFQKLILIKNSTKGAMQVLKSIYSYVDKIENFKDICHDLLDSYQFAKEYIQEKSLKILQQATKIKVSLPIKQIFPASLFVTIKHVSMKDYYHFAFGIIKPQLQKLMDKKDISPNSIAVVIRYAFGSDNSFYFKVYEQHIKSTLHKYENTTSVSEKTLLQIVEKIQHDFQSLNADPSRTVKIERAIMEIKDHQKRNYLIDFMIDCLQKKSSLANKADLKLLTDILNKIKDTALI